ncbi:MAG: hypothetical protein RL462_1125 [Pseudomonadota bacterium]|jgi:hypothetical protein
MKIIPTPQAVAKLPVAQRLAIGRQVLAQASATHKLLGGTQRAPNPFVNPQAFMAARRNAAQGNAFVNSLGASHVE